MIVGADTSLRNDLILIDHIDMLESLYVRIAIPTAVLARRQRWAKHVIQAGEQDFRVASLPGRAIHQDSGLGTILQRINEHTIT